MPWSLPLPGSTQLDAFPSPFHQKLWGGDFLGGAVVKNLPANAGDTGSSACLGRSHMPRSN